MGRADPRFLAVGHLNKAHGTRGELFVWPLTDHPESAFAPGVILLLGQEHHDAPDPDLPPLRVDSVRPFQKGYLVGFGGVADRNQAELLRGRYLYRAVEDLEPLGEGEVYHHQLLGMRVVTTNGVDVGEVTEVYELTPAVMLEVSGPRGQTLVPYLPDFVVETDVAGARLVIDPPEGLLDL